MLRGHSTYGGYHSISPSGRSHHWLRDVPTHQARSLTVAALEIKKS